MAVKSSKFMVEKKEKELYIHNVTDIVSNEIEKSGIKEGIVTVFVPGSTAGVSTIEYEPNLIRDLNAMLERITPSDVEYHHSKTWGEDNGKSHLRASLFGPSATIPFKDGKMMLGQWQQLVVMDFDTRMRKREVIVQIVY
ncbi:MAG: secondary thiamine-phosphate synthase enzyme YjbQ [Candidatus Micrarchaeota archaeon]|nr:secondary thiamine-phosphate synthase enzyme YjbQ [Candidatus Micrarchaeota archaeon]